MPNRQQTTVGRTHWGSDNARLGCIASDKGRRNNVAFQSSRMSSNRTASSSAGVETRGTVLSVERRAWIRSTRQKHEQGNRSSSSLAITTNGRVSCRQDPEEDVGGAASSRYISCLPGVPPSPKDGASKQLKRLHCFIELGAQPTLQDSLACRWCKSNVSDHAGRSDCFCWQALRHWRLISLR